VVFIIISKKTEKELPNSVGLLEWKETDINLKPASGKRSALYRVSSKAPYIVIFSKAIKIGSYIKPNHT